MKRVTIRQALVGLTEKLVLQDDEIVVQVEPTTMRDVSGLTLGWRVTYITESKE